MAEQKYDVIIIGGGPAGLTAGIYGVRAGLKTIIIERIMPGGYVSTISYIENYPGFPDGIKGMELANRMKAQAERFGVNIIGSEVISVKKQNNIFCVHTEGRDFQGKTIIIATGTTHRKIGVSGEVKLTGRGVSYCATCDGPLFRDRDIAVIGCGNSGLQEGRFLLNFVKHIYFVETLSCIIAEPVLQKPFENLNNVTFLVNHELKSINGDKQVESITVIDRERNEANTYKVDGVFIYAGVIPMSEMLKGFITLDKYGFVTTNNNLETSIPGAYAAGDIRVKKIRQIVNACSEGATAALNAYHYIERSR